MLKIFTRTMMVAAAVALLCTPAMAAPDYAITGTDSADPVAPGEDVTYTFTVSNLGDNNTFFLTVLDFELPLGVPANGTDAADALLDSILIDDAIWDDDPDTGSGLAWGPDTNYCEGWTFQFQDLPVDPGDTGDVVFTFPAPESVREGVVHFSGPDLDMSPEYGRGGCGDIEDCATPETRPCMGPRVLDVDGFTATLELVNDGSDNPTLGCDPISGFTPGNAALIDRGSCFFETKVINAVAAQASAVIIADNPTSDYFPDGIINMACTDFCNVLFVPIPVISVSYNNGQLIHAAMAAGDVTVTMGAQELDPPIMTVDSLFWEFDEASSERRYTDSNPDNDAWAETTLVSAVSVDPPVAAFDATANYLEVSFTDMSTGEGISSWMWDFGDDMGTSEEQSPMYTYAAAGTYTVSLTVTNDGGSDTATMDVTVEDMPTEPVLDKLYYVPAAAKAEGSAGSFFVTDMTINNAGATMANYKFLWLPRADANAEPAMSDAFTLDAGMSVVYSDVLGAAFGAEDGAVGALAVASDSDSLLLMSRTFNQTDSGTFGQSIPGYAAGNLIQAGERMRILFFVENDEFRTNLGLLNGTGADITIEWERFTADGTSVETGFKNLGPWGNTQVNSVFSGEAPVNGGYVDVWTETDGGAFAAYGSLLDNMTSDPTTVLPQ